MVPFSCDSGHDLTVVWFIYRRLCPSLDKVLANPPLNIKKQLLVKFPVVGSVVFSAAKKEIGEPFLCLWKCQPRGRG